MAWNQDLFPTYDVFRKDYDIAQQIYDAINERWEASNYYESPYPYPKPPLLEPRYRDQHGLLQNYKSFVLQAFLHPHSRRINNSGYWDLGSYPFIVPPLYGEYLDYPQFSNYSPTTMDWVKYQKDGYVDITRYNISQLTRTPANYFTYTPYRCLNGRGWRTVEELPYPVGEENEYTKQGGRYLPQGRSRWYSTDYGWQGLAKILNLMYIGKPYWSKFFKKGDGTYKEYIGNGDRYGYDDYCDTTAIAASNAYADYTIDPTDLAPQVKFQGGTFLYMNDQYTGWTYSSEDFSSSSSQSSESSDSSSTSESSESSESSSSESVQSYSSSSSGSAGIP